MNNFLYEQDRDKFLKYINQSSEKDYEITDDGYEKMMVVIDYFLKNSTKLFFGMTVIPCGLDVEICIRTATFETETENSTFSSIQNIISQLTIEAAEGGDIIVKVRIEDVFQEFEIDF